MQSRRKLYTAPRPLLLGALFLTFSLGTDTAHSAPQTAYTHYTQGLEFFLNSEFSEAETAFQNALGDALGISSPDTSNDAAEEEGTPYLPARYLLGLSQKHLEKNEEAKKTFKVLQSEAFQSVVYLDTQSEPILLDSQLPEESTNLARAATIDLEKAEYYFHVNLGRVFFLLDLHQEAVIAATQAIEIDQTSKTHYAPGAFQLRAQSSIALGNHEAAALDLDQVITEFEIFEGKNRDALPARMVGRLPPMPEFQITASKMDSTSESDRKFDSTRLQVAHENLVAPYYHRGWVAFYMNDMITAVENFRKSVDMADTLRRQGNPSWSRIQPFQVLARDALFISYSYLTGHYSLGAYQEAEQAQAEAHLEAVHRYFSPDETLGGKIDVHTNTLAGYELNPDSFRITELPESARIEKIWGDQDSVLGFFPRSHARFLPTQRSFLERHYEPLLKLSRVPINPLLERFEENKQKASTPPLTEAHNPHSFRVQKIDDAPPTLPNHRLIGELETIRDDSELQSIDPPRVYEVLPAVFSQKDFATLLNGENRELYIRTQEIDIYRGTLRDLRERAEANKIEVIHSKETQPLPLNFPETYLGEMAPYLERDLIYRDCTPGDMMSWFWNVVGNYWETVLVEINSAAPPSREQSASQCIESQGWTWTFDEMKFLLERQLFSQNGPFNSVYFSGHDFTLESYFILLRQVYSVKRP